MCARAPRGPALVIDRDGDQGHVGVGVLDVALQYGDVAAKAHWPDPGLVQESVELVLELRDDRVRVPSADRARDRFLCEIHRVDGRTADPYADAHRRAPL